MPLTQVLSDPTREIFLIRREKIEKFNISRGIFPNPNLNHGWLTRPFWTRVNIFGPNTSLLTKANATVM